MDPIYAIGLMTAAGAIGAGSIAGASAVAVVLIQGAQHRRERAEDRADRRDVAAAAAAHAREQMAAIAENTALTRQTEISTNSMKDALVKTTAIAADLVGEKRGREDEIARAAAVAEGRAAAEKAAEDLKGGPNGG